MSSRLSPRQARSRHGRHRHVGPVMLPGQEGGGIGDQGTGQTERKESGSRNRRLARMTAPVPGVPELRYLIARLLPGPPVSRAFIMHRSPWRRKHRADAARAHCRRRAGQAQPWY